MFDNPEKLFILFVIALMIFGPSKLASLGASLGRSIRDFRNTVRGAQDEFRSAMQEHVDAITPALPSPDAFSMEPAAGGTETSGGPETGGVDYGTAMSTPATPDTDVLTAYTATGNGAGPDGPGAASAASTVDGAVSTGAAPDDDPSSLVSEPTAAALKESLSR